MRRDLATILPLLLLWFGSCIPTVGSTTFFRCADGGGFCTSSGQLALDGGIDGGRDGGPVDAGPDGGPDAGPDAGPDGGPDAGPDGGPVDAGGCVITGTGALPDLLYPRWGLAGASIFYQNDSTKDLRFFAVGGFDPSGATTADVEFDEYDMGDSWAPVGSAGLSPRAFFPIVAQQSLGLFAIGGEDPESHTVYGDMVLLPYNTAPAPTAVWDEQMPQLIQARQGHAAVLESDGVTAITCGGQARGITTATCETINLSDLDAGWQPGPTMIHDRQGLSMAVGADQNVYAFSGTGFADAGGSFETSWEMLDSASGTWTCPGSCPQMNQGHVQGVAVVLGNLIYVLGGLPQQSSESSLATGEYIDITKISAGWQMIAPMQTGRSAFAAVATPSGTIRVFGGVGGPENTCTVASVEEYSPSNNDWQ